MSAFEPLLLPQLGKQSDRFYLRGITCRSRREMLSDSPNALLSLTRIGSFRRITQSELVSTKNRGSSVFVYDDKAGPTFDYSGDNRTITLREIGAGL